MYGVQSGGNPTPGPFLLLYTERAGPTQLAIASSLI